MAEPKTIPADGNELLPAELLEGLGSLELVARTIVRGFINGAHRSPFLGSGEDFSRHRAYQQGDDVRRLDWKLYGRTDRLYVRLFQEDSNLQGFLLVDGSASMGFVGDGPVSKLRYAQFIAAALAHVMLKSGDAPGLASFGKTTDFLLPPRNRLGHLHDLLLALERIRPQGHGDASQALSQVGGGLRRKGRVILLSDCLEERSDSLLESVGRLRARGDEVIVIRISTLVELGETSSGPARYYDPETPQHTTSAVPANDPGFRERVAAYYETLRQGLEERGAEYVPITTDQPLLTALNSWLMSRSQFQGSFP